MDRKDGDGWNGGGGDCSGDSGIGIWHWEWFIEILLYRAHNKSVIQFTIAFYHFHNKTYTLNREIDR